MKSVGKKRKLSNKYVIIQYNIKFQFLKEHVKSRINFNVETSLKRQLKDVKKSKK